MKRTALIIGTLLAAGWAPIAAAQDPGELVVVKALQERGYMGVRIAFVDGALVVSDVLAGTPAEKAGLQAGDRILKLGEQATTDEEQVQAFLAGTTVGQMLTLHIERGDKHANIRLRLVSLASFQGAIEEQVAPVSVVIAETRPEIVLVRPASEPREVVIIEHETESESATSRLQISRVRAISKLRAAARLETETRRSEAESVHVRPSAVTRVRSNDRADAVQKEDAAAKRQRRAEFRARADARKARADERRAVAARKRAENDLTRSATERAAGEEEARESVEVQQLDELKRELDILRDELERLRAQIRKVSREMGDG